MCSLYLSYQLEIYHSNSFCSVFIKQIWWLLNCAAFNWSLNVVFNKVLSMFLNITQMFDKDTWCKFLLIIFMIEISICFFFFVTFSMYLQIKEIHEGRCSYNPSCCPGPPGATGELCQTCSLWISAQHWIPFSHTDWCPCWQIHHSPADGYYTLTGCSQRVRLGPYISTLTQHWDIQGHKPSPHPLHIWLSPPTTAS